MPSTPHPDAARRTERLGELAQGTERFHEPRRADCPWCGSTRLRTRLRTRDLVQHKPGTFVVDQCRDCAHTFQNPRLSAEGIAFYHRDVHEDHTEHTLTARGGARRHRAAARAMLPFPEPESWLDVGTGHGRFPQAAKEVHPYTSFDGLDPTRRVDTARAAGRIEEAHRGHLTDPEILARLRSRYDVVSMVHHLEHAPDPRAELRAALTVLRPGGHLLIEVADPDCAFGALLGKWWVSYGQPCRLQLMPRNNLLAELEAGCSAPVGAIAEVVESIDEEGRVFEELSLRGCVAALDGSDVIRASGVGTSGGARELGLSVAAELFELGARELMREARQDPARGSMGNDWERQ